MAQGLTIILDILLTDVEHEGEDNPLNPVNDSPRSQPDLNHSGSTANGNHRTNGSASKQNGRLHKRDK